jgi:hypothetical protein
VPRQLNSRSVRRSLDTPPTLAEDLLLDVITDISASMTGGNDALGLRHEAILILLEHLAAKRRQGLNSRLGPEKPSWYFQCRTFDKKNTCLDIGRVKLDSKSLPSIRRALLAPTFGGSSVLGPALHSSAADAGGWQGRHVRVVMSDFELYDKSVPDVLDRFADSAADVNLALVFGESDPGIDKNRVRVHSVSSPGDSPATVCELVLGVIRDACATHWSKAGGSATLAPQGRRHGAEGASADLEPPVGVQDS